MKNGEGEHEGDNADDGSDAAISTTNILAQGHGVYSWVVISIGCYSELDATLVDLS